MKIVLTGGFLGSGKSTAIRQACGILFGMDRKAAVITNDQGLQQVDSAYMKAENIPVCSVSNGCFCCRYPELDQHLTTLTNQFEPELIFAESVGSCTDLIATVVNPLLQFRPAATVVLSIFADARMLLKIAEGQSVQFDSTVQYIYEKQLEEADILVLTKVDLLKDEEWEPLRQQLLNMYPGKQVLFQNSTNPEDVLEWLNAIAQFEPPTHRKSLDIDYTLYGQGEAMLAWLDEELELDSITEDAPVIAHQLIEQIYQQIRQHYLPIGHLKFFLSYGNHQEKISFTHTDEVYLKPTDTQEKSRRATLLINARIQTTPEHLHQLVSEQLYALLSAQDKLKIRVKEMAAFQPGFPTPTHRISS